MMDKKKHNINRREFLKRLGIGAGSAFALMTLETMKASRRKAERMALRVP